MTRQIPGLLLAISTTIAAVALQQVLGLKAFGLDAVTLSLLLGMLLSAYLGQRPQFADGLKLASKQLLSAAVVMLGLGLDLAALTRLGWRAAIAVAVSMTALLLLARPLGRLFRVPGGRAFLIGTGTAICGSAAIAAIYPLVPDADETDTGISLATINLLGAVGMLLMPPLLLIGGATDRYATLVIGGSLQAVGHVVGAGASMSTEVAEAATALKMGRVALLVPVALIVATIARRQPGTRPGKAPGIPNYLWGFVVAAVIGSTGLVSPEVLAAVKDTAKMIMAVVMAAIGLRIDLRALRHNGLSSVMLGAALFAMAIAILSVIGG